MTARSPRIEEPRLPADVVPRARLEDRIGPDTGATWSLVVGPAGAGKSTFVREWLSRRPEPWAWITVTSDPSEPVVLASAIVRAIQRIVPDVAFDALDEVGMSEASVGHLLDTMLGDLETARGPAKIVVVDDVHWLHQGHWDVLDPFLEGLTPSLHVVLLSRADPPIPVGRRRASGRMAEVRAQDLAFDGDETLALLTAHLDVGAATACVVTERTEGWVAGIRLALLASGDEGELHALVTRAGGAYGTVAELFLEEVLERLPTAVQQLLLDLAVVVSFDTALAEALTGRPDAADVLSGLSRQGAFVTVVDDARNQFKFHRMFAEMLYGELSRADPQRARHQHLVAADWLHTHGSTADAVEQWLRAGEHLEAHRVVLDQFRILYQSGDRREIADWLRAVPDEVVAEDLDLAIEHCSALALLADPSAREWYRRCDALVGPGQTDRRAHLDVLLALDHGLVNDLDGLRDHLERARAAGITAAVRPAEEVVATWEIRLETHFGDPGRAVGLGRAFAASERVLVGDPPALSVLSGALLVADGPASAAPVAMSALERWRAAGEPDLPAMTDALLVAARECRESGALADARDLAGHARELTAFRGRGHLLGALVTIELAAIDRAAGANDWDRALVSVAEELRMRGAPAALVDRVDAARRGPRPLEHGPSPHVGASGLIDPLTERERTILGLMSSHLSFPEIGHELFISRFTVKSHAQRVYRKLGVTSRSEAVAEARRLGLIPSP